MRSKYKINSPILALMLNTRAEMTINKGSMDVTTTVFRYFCHCMVITGFLIGYDTLKNRYHALYTQTGRANISFIILFTPEGIILEPTKEYKKDDGLFITHQQMLSLDILTVAEYLCELTDTNILEIQTFTMEEEEVQAYEQITLLTDCYFKRLTSLPSVENDVYVECPFVVDFISEDHEMIRVGLSYNPILSIYLILVQDNFDIVEYLVPSEYIIGFTYELADALSVGIG